MVALGLGGLEAGNPPEPFAPWFERAREGGLHSAPHAGEIAGPESVWGALRVLGAERIGHGVRAAEDPTLVAHLVASGVPRKSAPPATSAWGSTPASPAHPLRALHDAGVRLTVNSDDPALFNTTLQDEVATLSQAFGFTESGADVPPWTRSCWAGCATASSPRHRRAALSVTSGTGWTPSRASTCRPSPPPLPPPSKEVQTDPPPRDRLQPPLPCGRTSKARTPSGLYREAGRARAGRGVHTSGAGPPPTWTAWPARASSAGRPYQAMPVHTLPGQVLTGLYPHTHGATHNNIPLPPAAPTVAELAAARKATLRLRGHWHLGRELQPQRGFEDPGEHGGRLRPRPRRGRLLHLPPLAGGPGSPRVTGARTAPPVFSAPPPRSPSGGGSLPSWPWRPAGSWTPTPASLRPLRQLPGAPQPHRPPGTPSTTRADTLPAPGTRPPTGDAPPAPPAVSTTPARTHLTATTPYGLLSLLALLFRPGQSQGRLRRADPGAPRRPGPGRAHGYWSQRRQWGHDGSTPWWPRAAVRRASRVPLLPRIPGLAPRRIRPRSARWTSPLPCWTSWASQCPRRGGAGRSCPLLRERTPGLQDGETSSSSGVSPPR